MEITMKKVMIVEDEELILQGIRNILDWEALGLDVVLHTFNSNTLVAVASEFL